MRIGVLDVGSNAAHLLVAHVGDGVPVPVHTAKTRLRLADRLDGGGALNAEAVDRLATAVADAVHQADRWGVEELFAYATAVVRDAPNRDEVLAAVAERTGVRLGLLSGTEEAELTFLAARRWMGWRAGPLLLLDIGGGTLEIAYGHDVSPEWSESLPLGAARLTREWLADDPPRPAEVRALRRYLRRQLADVAVRLRRHDPRTAVATSRTFHQLARLCGAPAESKGPLVPRRLRRTVLRRQVDRLAALPAARRAELPGISAPRARQSVAGAVVAHALLAAFNLDEVEVCPWALREGILLRRIEGMAAGPGQAIRLEARPHRPAPDADAQVLAIDRARRA
jgi:exopolyphosphatase/guanosine-5'-triphosphate,3'-diphosphate pyrophosphatase